MRGQASLVLAVVLMVSLTVSSAFIATVVQNVFNPASTRTATVHLRLIPQGTLVVNELPVFPSDPEPRAGQSFTVLGNSGTINPETNGTDHFAVTLQPGDYVLRVNDPRFRLAIPFEIQLGNTTIVTLLVVKHAAFPYFASVPDADSSGWVVKNDSILAGFFLPSISMHEGDLAFIEVPKSTGYSGVDSNATGRMAVTGVTARGEVTFVGLRALESFRSTAIAGSLVVMYDPTYSVRIVPVQQ